MRPNFLVFMTDHQRGDMQPPYGKIHTPNLARLYANGVGFTRAYCPSPHCCPSRATFFSGLYPSMHGVWNNVNVSNTLSRGLHDGVRLFSQDLREAGYRLYFSGKWHVSDVEGPEHRGFENIHPGPRPLRPYENLPDTREWATYRDGARRLCDVDAPRVPGEIKRSGYTHYKQYGIHENPFKDADVVDAALRKLDDMPQNEPFFMYVGTLGPHDPYFVPQRFLDMYPAASIRLPESHNDAMADKPALYRRTAAFYSQLSPEEHIESIRHYYAFCTYEDYLFGRLLDKLQAHGQLDNTVVIYNSDHGDYVGSHGLWAKGLPCFHEAYHVCSVVGYGGVAAKGRAVDDFISLADYAPSILELAGVSSPAPFAGRSFAPFLRGESVSGWRQEMYTQTNGNEVYGIQRSVFDRRYKYVFNTFDFDELYDLQHDPHEMKNLIGRPQMQPVVRAMCERMWRFAYDNKDNIVNPYIMTAFAPHGPGVIFQGEK